ncbi:hypothetical protein TVAG_135050 [Trichomonas vaginalis G3]|uniref:DUF3447 domain-containing protein n=1 Tax=Trichomonas vaginalis (strain ATCC PRA-98 / G3) TaxID=412133 RepID=A2FKI6_TRIV3|nr:protein of unknown function (DUF3447) [Trichomonas vaginalis G3]EAX94598.1 hypothetical protein TVAG_135050 [Trichomonas vaginalis G3]KAI5542798.1 protein of unknown function (DUF3447) [Trichomonas vaginalis G3]|eukprot:XP_001307528.1 hypothetical protein [Trichomonas vaginalis G3]
MYNDLERFISFTEREGFDKDQLILSSLYPYNCDFSLLELCCYHGAVDCFKLLLTNKLLWGNSSSFCSRK